jgi:acetoacetyl-CoA synthetase
MRWAGERRGRPFADYDELWHWSVDALEDFWAAIWDFFEVRASQPYEQVLGDRSMPGARWFTGAELNYAEHILGDRDPAGLAVQHASETRTGRASTGEPGEMTWGELTDQVARVAAGLRSLGVERGDRVVAYMPNIPETLVAFLSVSSLGAIWSSAAPEFGARSVVDRFAQIEPKVLLAVDGYRYGGKDFDRTELVAGLLEDLPTVEHAVAVPYLAESPDTSGWRDVLTWSELQRGDDVPDLTYDRAPQGDRPGPRRDPAGTAQEGSSAPGPAS